MKMEFLTILIFILILKILLEENCLIILMNIEIMMLISYFIFFLVLSSSFSLSIMLPVYFTIMVCESVLGFVLFVSMTRISNMEKIYSMTMLKY